MGKRLKRNEGKQGLLSRIFTNNKYCWIAFGCSAAIMAIVYFCFSVIPFGDGTVLRMDLYHQYGPLFAEFCDRVTDFKSLIYSWNTSILNSVSRSYSGRPVLRSSVAKYLYRSI